MFETFGIFEIIFVAFIGASIIHFFVTMFLDSLKNTKSPSEEIKQIENKTVDAIPHLPLQTEGAFGTKPIKPDAVIIKTLGIKSPSDVLNCDALEKGIISVNNAREIAGFEPINEFQKVAHDFGNTTKTVDVGGSTIRRASNCPNCGANLTQNGVCVYCGTTYN